MGQQSTGCCLGEEGDYCRGLVAIYVLSDVREGKAVFALGRGTTDSNRRLLSGGSRQQASGCASASFRGMKGAEPTESVAGQDRAGG